MRSSPAFTCNDVWANAGGNYLGCVDPTGTAGNNPACGLVGVYPVACGTSPAEPMTWGAIKTRFRK